ncbi:MAG TPA: amidohydrolase family protein [Chthonomonadaceae bacterium]|nr:amidohydrolase family protein [Chthonomonadaceae bacterium]
MIDPRPYRFSVLLGAAVVTLIAPAGAQQRQRRTPSPEQQPAAQSQAAAPPPSSTPPAPPVRMAIVGGDVWTVTNGVIRGGTVLVKDGKIEQVGDASLKPPADARIVDARGFAVVPGFVVANERVTSPVIGGKYRDSLDPYALAIELAAASGVTTTFLSGAEPGLGSTNAVIKMTCGDLSGMAAAESTGSSFNPTGGRFARGSGLNARWSLRDQMRRGKEFLAKLPAYEADKKAGKPAVEPKKPADADAVLPVLKKERPLRVVASTVGEIRWALSLVDEFDIRLVLTPATEAWIVADEIAKRGAMVIFTPRNREEPDERRNAPSGANPDAAGILQKAGVKFAVEPLDNSFAVGGELGRDLLNYPLEAAFAMRGGADAQSALESITLTPAKIIGMEKRLGSIEAGKDADILLLSGEPLDYRSFVEKTFINGRLYYDRSKSTFFDRIKPQKGVPTAPAQ